MLHDGQMRQEQLLRDLGGKLDALTGACQGMSGKIEGLALTPSLVRMQMFGMAVVIVLVAISSGAQVAMSAGWLKVESTPVASQEAP